jgi:hypothetical protein
MKLSNETITIMKDFAEVQPGLIIPPGNTMYTGTSVVYAEAVVAETFPKELRILRLKDFIRTVELFAEPEISFSEDSILINEGAAQVVYPQAKAGLQSQLQQMKKVKPEPADQILLNVTAAEWASILNAFGMGLTKRKKRNTQPTSLVIVSDGKTVRLEAERGFGQASYSVILGGTTSGRECKITLAAGIPLITGPYRVMVTAKYVRFVHTGGFDYRYYVGSDPRLSTWGGKKNYLVVATKSVAQDCQFDVFADSPEEAEAIVRQKQAADFTWEPEPRTQTTFKVVA